MSDNLKILYFDLLSPKYINIKYSYVDISDSYCGWFLQDDTSTTGSYHPNQRGGNSIGLRAGTSSLGTWGDLGVPLKGFENAFFLSSKSFPPK